MAKFSNNKIILGFFLMAAVGCASNAADRPVTYKVSAQENYTLGLERLEQKGWVGAAKYFSFVRSQFPYTRFAVLAELRLADAEFGAGHYLAAVDSYKTFITFHPKHEMVLNGYAPFRIGESFFRMIPEDTWLLPPAREKDQGPAREASLALASFIRKYRSSPYLERAKKMLVRANRRLADHEWYVAAFYWKRDKPRGTMIRLRSLLANYPGVGFDARALWRLGEAYIVLKKPERAKEVWQKLIDEHPKTTEAGQARTQIASLSKR